MIKAKPVIPDQFWILRDRDDKVGNIETDGKDYVVSIGGDRRRFSDLKSLTNSIDIVFEPSKDHKHDAGNMHVHGYPTTSTAYNAVFDVQHQLPLWTVSPNSRSWMAAGWYRVRQHSGWRAMHCPKLIILKRYDYQGPFRSLQEAQKPR